MAPQTPSRSGYALMTRTYHHHRDAIAESGQKPDSLTKFSSSIIPREVTIILKVDFYVASRQAGRARELETLIASFADPDILDPFGE